MSLSDYIYQEPMNTNDAIRFVESWARKTMRLSTADIREGVLALIAERDALKAERDQLREYLDASLLREGIGDRLAVALKADLALATAREAALRNALQALVDEQNGPPLLKSAPDWRWAMALADALLADPNPAAERLLRIEAAARDADEWAEGLKDPAQALMANVLLKDWAPKLHDALADMEAK